MTETNKDPVQIEEQALDALLKEVVGGAAPPDLSPDILQQLRVTPLEVATVVRAEARASKTHESSIRKPITLVVAAVASLAATVLLAVWLRSDRVLEDVSIAESTVDQDWLDSHFPMERSPVNGDAPSNAVAENESSRGVPMVAGPTSDSRSGNSDIVEKDAAEKIAGTPSSSPQASVAEVTLVSKQVDDQVNKYWQEIGIEPSAEAGAEAIVARLSMALGVRLPGDSIDDPKRLELEFAKRPTARRIATRWLDQISQRGLLRVEEEPRQKLIAELMNCFESKRQFDETLARWISGQSPNSPAFYTALSSGAKDYASSSSMVRRVASLTMNVDLRCVRCHDSHIEGNGRQRDYWAFAAFLRHGLASDAAEIKPLFYDLPDGRRRIAEPAMAKAWMSTGSERPTSDLRQWSRQLIGSEQLARGVVNSLWQLVHGQPLRGRVVDPISAPHHDTLDRLEEDLSQDLVASRFDIARTLALIVASPVTQRGVPKPLLPENALVADESETREAMDAVDAFAAALPTRPRLGLNARLDEALRAIGMKLDADGRSFVAQISNTPDGSAGTSGSSKSLSVDFPYRADALPVQWLNSIKDPQSQVEHLTYLAGIDRAPDQIAKAAESMRAEDVDNNLTLHRIWWMVRP
jgi:hypothetical protein